jgi:hypothetical protein
MDKKSKWNKKNKKSIITQNKNTDFTPSNQNQLPLETYMIPVSKNDSNSNSNSNNDSKSSDFQKMTTEQKKDYLLDIYTKYMDFIDSLNEYIDAYEYRFSTFLAESFSGKTNTSEDIDVIKRNLISFLNILISLIIVYNWYFILLFHDEKGEKIKIPEFSLHYFHENFALPHMFFKYSFCVLSMLTTCVLNFIPLFINYIRYNPEFDRRIQFIFLFALIIFIVTNFGKTILGLMNKKFIGIFATIFVFYGIYTFIAEFIPPSQNPIEMATKLKKYAFLGLITPLLYIFLFTIRIIWSISIISLSSLSCFFFLILTSFFTLCFYSKNSIYETFNNINIFIRSYENNPDKNLVFDTIILLKNINKVKKTESENGLFQKFSKILFENFYTYLFEIVLIFTLFLSLIDYSYNLKNTKNLQFVMISLCSAIILIISYIIYLRMTNTSSIKSPIISTLSKSSLTDLATSTLSKSSLTDLATSALSKSSLTDLATSALSKSSLTDLATSTLSKSSLTDLATSALNKSSLNLTSTLSKTPLSLSTLSKTPLSNIASQYL